MNAEYFTMRTEICLPAGSESVFFHISYIIIIVKDTRFPGKTFGLLYPNQLPRDLDTSSHDPHQEVWPEPTLSSNKYHHSAVDLSGLHLT